MELIYKATATATYTNEMRIWELFTSETLADVKFLFEGEKEISAHRFILATKSVVFRKLFFGDLKETGNIKIDDVTPEAFTEFLQFFYLDEVKLTGDNIEEVMDLADKYDVPQCMAACSKFLKDILVPDNMRWIYEMALLYTNEDLITHCEEKIQIDPKSMFDTLSFKYIDRVVLKCILAIDLHCDELTVFNACMDWAKAKCERENIDGNNENYKEALGDCFKRIRFPAMTNKEFCSVLQDYKGLFDVDTLTDVFMHITLEKPLQVATQFNGDCRHIQLNISRNHKYSKICNHTINQQEMMKFSTNQRIVIKGIVINDRIHALILFALVGNIKVFNHELSKAKLLLEQDVQLSNVNSNYYEFLKPIIVHPQQKYEIQIIFETVLKGKTFSVQIQKYDEKVIIDKGIEFKFESSQGADYDNVHYGVISGLRFVPM